MDAGQTISFTQTAPYATGYPEAITSSSHASVTINPGFDVAATAILNHLELPENRQRNFTTIPAVSRQPDAESARRFSSLRTPWLFARCLRVTFSHTL